MSVFTFVHAADLHLDTPFEGLGRVAPEIAEFLRDSSLAAWDELVSLCIEREALFLLIAGDIYDGEERGLRAQLRFLRGLERLSEHGVGVFIAHGNHDPHGDSRWSAIRQWPASVTVFGHEGVQSIKVSDREGRLVAVVHGISHSSRTVAENLSLRFHRTLEPCPHFGVLHCNADGDPHHPAYAPCTIEDLRSAGIDYWALGHIHQHRVLSPGEPWIVYSGGLQGRSLKPGEVGIKGAVVGRVTDNRMSDIQFVTVPHVRFADLQLDIAGIPDVPGLLERLEDQVQIVREEGPSTGLVLRVTLTGRGPLHADLVSPDRLADLLKTMREEAAGHRPFLWWNRIVMATHPDLDRDAIGRRGDFSSELVQLAGRLREDGESLFRFMDEEERLLQAGALRRWVEVAPADRRTLLDEAETLALERLEARSDQ
jgi:DNA repair protein SbcD/Mre11